MPLLRRSEVWVVDYTWDGRPRRWLKALPEGIDAHAAMRDLLQDLYGPRARLAQVRRATEAEEIDFVRGKLPHNPVCPTGRAPRNPPD